MFSHYNAGSSERQKEIMLRTATAPGGNVIIAYTRDGIIVGYLCVVPPDPEERWGGLAFPFVVEFGLVEVSRAWRGLGLAGKMMEFACADPELEEKIAVTTSYAWHWDLRETGLTKWEYRMLLQRLLIRHDFEQLATDEENITFDPANMLMVRFGSAVPREQVAKFERTLFRKAA